MSPRPWPYPFWIAHRGGGRAAPENTLAAFRHGLHAGFKMYECDVKLSLDQIPFLLHDDTLERTSTGHGLAGDQPWSTLRDLDAGSWYSPEFAGEPIATLAQVSRFCQFNQCLLNLEIKPSPGTEALTGRVVAQAVESLWQQALHRPLLTSFSEHALQAAQQAAPTLARGLLLETLPPNWLERMRLSDCHALICRDSIITADLVAQVHAQGNYCLAYTVNDPWTAADLLSMGIDGLITDALDLPMHMRRSGQARR